MVARVQEARIGTNNTPPADGSLLPGQFYLEMGTPTRLWVGVPTSIVASGAKLLMDVDAQTAANASYVPKAGATMTGPLVLSGEPAAALGAATKQTVDLKAPIASPTFTGTPTLPTGTVAVTQTAGNSTTALATTAFVTTADALKAPLASPALTGNPTSVTPAPGDNDTSIATTAFVTAAVAPTGNNVGRNLVHNPLFNVAQRGTTGFTANGYTLDRWQTVFLVAGQTVAIQQYPFTIAQAATLGDEAAKFMLLNNFTGAATTGAHMLVQQLIEDVLRLSGKTVTVSFWASAGAALNLGVGLTQNFGTGGSPSTQVSVTGQKVAVTTFWQRYSLTFTLPSVSGKTLGSNNNNGTALEFWYSSDIATYGARNANLGAQSGQIYIWGVQLEIGSVMTPLDKPYDQGADLRNCQRFYQAATLEILGAAYGAGAYLSTMVSFPVTMHHNPTVSTTWTTTTNTTAPGVTPMSAYGMLAYVQGTALGTVILIGSFAASADL